MVIIKLESNSGSTDDTYLSTYWKSKIYFFSFLQPRATYVVSMFFSVCMLYLVNVVADAHRFVHTLNGFWVFVGFRVWVLTHCRCWLYFSMFFISHYSIHIFGLHFISMAINCCSRWMFQSFMIYSHVAMGVLIVG